MQRGIYHQLNAEMARKGITRSALADSIGMQRTTLSFKMNGKSDFTIKESKQIKKALGVDLPLEELFSVNEDDRTA